MVYARPCQIVNWVSDRMLLKCVNRVVASQEGKNNGFTGKIIFYHRVNMFWHGVGFNFYMLTRGENDY